MTRNRMQSRRTKCRRTTANRRGAASVEFAMVAPLFLMLVMGLVEYSIAINAYNTLYAAVREGGRLASMEFSAYVTPNQSANDKVIHDIRAFLNASGLPGDVVAIAITDVETGAAFDLSASENYMRLFQISASVPYDQISLTPVSYFRDAVIRTQMVYRRGQVRMVQ